MLRRMFLGMIGTLSFRFKSKRMIRIIEIVTNNETVEFRENSSGTRAINTVKLNCINYENVNLTIKDTVKKFPGFHIFLFRKSNLTEQVMVVGNNSILIVDPKTMLIKERWVEVD